MLLGIKQRHIVFATAGSLGDLHPFLALGLELKQRGHRVTVASSAIHQPIILKAGLGFRHMRPDPDNTPAFHARYMHPKTGGQFVYRDYLGPSIRTSYADLAQATQDADMLVSQSLMALAAPLVAARIGIPWVSAVLQPMSFFSTHERPHYLPFPWLSWLCGRSPQLHGKVIHSVKIHTAKWLRPVLELKQELGIVHHQHPMYEGQHSPLCVLAMFSPLLGGRQPDWPASVVQTGTALYLSDSGPVPAKLKQFLEQNSKPLVIFTLSSAASNDAGDFYRDSLNAAASLGLRALLVMGGLAASSALPAPLPDGAFRIDYAAFEDVFPHAAMIVHSGGAATSFKALQSGKPQIVVPHAHDQLDNAMRLSLLGVAIVIKKRRPGKRALRKALQTVLANADMQDKAVALGLQTRQENGVQQACDAIERHLVYA
ncbi:hypothetical protein CR103_09835 [Massilia psychrophila]|uniref:Uncharacterized protein n=2 Tax=Massilia psychrophila TaxID=1603353 RepID=A0A2G8T1Z4_9BURK|nr:hypothetical protein CR103_09835 [Massilia psychrophila]GGE78957.1 glucosyltransferase [Massilia psychrophila]